MWDYFRFLEMDSLQNVLRISLLIWAGHISRSSERWQDYINPNPASCCMVQNQVHRVRLSYRETVAAPQDARRYYPWSLSGELSLLARSTSIYSEDSLSKTRICEEGLSQFAFKKWILIFLIFKYTLHGGCHIQTYL